MAYFTCTNNGKWESTKAQSLESAKRVAQKRCIFQGQTVRVGAGEEGSVIEVARRSADPINMNNTGEWIEV